MRALIRLLPLLFIGTAGAASGDAQADIDALLNRLQSSGCEFNRNGDWHGAAAARAHLQRKREYIEKRTTLRSAEQFIELAASSSSLSGRAYQVRCAGLVQPSAQWLQRELSTIRAARPPASPR